MSRARTTVELTEVYNCDACNTSKLMRQNVDVTPDGRLDLDKLLDLVPHSWRRGQLDRTKLYCSHCTELDKSRTSVGKRSGRVRARKGQ